MLEGSANACTAAAEGVDEHSALVSNPFAEAPDLHQAQEQARGIKENDDGTDLRKIRWIMTSVWLRTFCAGLGTSFPIHVMNQDRSKAKRLKLDRENRGFATPSSTIATDFEALSLIAWLATAYLVATSIT